jgi:hypothetical protein
VHDRAYRLRELARTAIGPRSAKAGLQWRTKSSPETLESVERHRLLSWADRNVGRVPSAYCREELGAKIPAIATDVRALTLLAVQATQKDFDNLHVMLEESGPAGRWAARLGASARGQINSGSSFEDVAKTAQWLEEYLENLEEDPELTKPEGDEEEGEEEGDRDTLKEDMERLFEYAGYHGYDGTRNVGVMSIERPALSVPVRPARSSRGKRSAEEGDSLRDITRLMTDGRVFAARRKKVGGSVLVDCSGSMSWDHEDLVRVISEAPAALVAAYSGNGGRGVLRIVAKAGRRVPDEDVNTYQNGNEIDIPALEWLAKQREPRVWLSDGEVCGSGADTDWLLMQATRVCRSGRIRRVNTASEILPALAGRTGVQGGREGYDV